LPRCRSAARAGDTSGGTYTSPPEPGLRLSMQRPSSRLWQANDPKGRVMEPLLLTARSGSGAGAAGPVGYRHRDVAAV